jgi:RNA-directed DNA polymerase
MPGVDGVRLDAPAERMKAALSLVDKGYKASPLKMIVIRPKGFGKERRIKIPIARDRAMQTLHAFALDPVSETTGDRRSFAFRKNRSLQDAHAYIMSALRKKNIEYVVKTDVKACYESISHAWLLSHIPMDTDVLRAFLKAGHVFAGELFPPEDHGISLGVSISPILGNMVLDGLQREIFKGIYGFTHEDADYCNGSLVRFADDVFVTARNLDSAKKIIRIIENFLQPRGMRLSAEKTTIINVRRGFDFLSRHYVRRDDVVKARPSKASILRMENDLQELIAPFKGSQKELIDKLNRKLIGWASYHKTSSARVAFRHIDVVVKTFLLQLCEKLHPNWPREKIISRYFFLDYDGKYVYAMPDKKDARVIRIAKTPLIDHRPICENANPYLDSEYQEKRNNERDIQNVVGRYRSIWDRQDGKCYYCGAPILADQKKSIAQTCSMKIHHIKNFVYIHAQCEQNEIEFISSEESFDSATDILDELQKLAQKSPKRKNVSKFSTLSAYFQQQTNAMFTLLFDDFVDILNKPLCKTASKFSGYWYLKGRGKISDAWRLNGYKIKKLELSSKRITFVRVGGDLPVKIPEVFLRGRVPPNAKAELEIFFDYLLKKYCL